MSRVRSLYYINILFNFNIIVLFNWLQRNLKTSNNVQRQREDESIKHRLKWLENSDMWHKRLVPRESDNESRYENIEDEDEKLGEHVRLRLRFGNFLDHFIR
jgi:hypothetical protein